MSNGCLSMLLRRMGFQGLLHERGLIDSAWLRQQLGSMARRRQEPRLNGITRRKSCREALLAMAVTPYRVTAARIGNSSGLRLPAAFYRDHPQFAGAAGQLEVLDDSTLLLRLEPEKHQQGEAEEETLMLGLFLDFLSRQALTSDQGPVLYTEAMAADDVELLAGVTVDAVGELLGA